MTTGLPDLPEGQELTPGRRWWRRAIFLPLLLLAMAAFVALIVGFVTSARIAAQEAEPAPVVASTIASGAAATCRPPVAVPDRQPWWGDDPMGEQVWAEHADEIAEPYLTGPEGWMFWSDNIDQYASQAVGRAFLNQVEVQRWVDHLAALRDGFAADGVEFYIVVTPSTSSVYPEQLPNWMQDVRGPTILDQLLASAGDLPVIDLRQRLIEQKTPDTHLFSWDNSHWTDFGAWSSWRQIADCVNELYPDSALQVPAVSGSEVVGDYNEWAPFGAQSPGADWSVPIYVDPLQAVTRTLGDGTVETVPGTSITDASTLPVETSVAAPWTGKSALIFRDSMGGGLSPLWQQAYSPTWQVWQRYGASIHDPKSYQQYVAEHHPDVAILQLAERHLVNTPPEGSGY